ncbi:ectoine/hydroxyectoine ABC transporter substrate-binding protein EhuB [Pseudonocardia humida]|uniref:Ectoine/hydroxyectoine ABC transporter substrate-binding protein EhuB n=1 Tax=Pseudonocardia humida TaxID=2800819 RepID=A0ABT0ZVI2_9PSEU|nr:ectoine/hydroxyectoine ABC transporter substrate-binding protein EhuB [Pseudonocardia humida]MCO1654664.1 ectoine/hydroxyectoine ABC transporter substrate-binding protein EhuB [Pseudonocardia humida]
MSGRSWSRRDLLRRGALAGAVVLGGPTALSACTAVPSGGGGAEGGAGTLERAREAGTITVGIANEAPYGFTDAQGRVTGESVEVARAVLGKLGIGRVDAITVEFGELIPGLTLSRQFDMVTAGMFITPQRCEAAAFSAPDYTAPTAFLVPAGNPAGITSFDQVRDQELRVAVLNGAVEQGYATDSGVPADRVQVLGDQNALLQAVASGRVDCAALTNISLNDVVSKNPGAPVEVTAGFFPVIDGEEIVSAGGFVFRQGEDDILDAFNTELTALQQSGEWLRIVAPFGFTQDNLPGPDVTTAALCAA